MDSMSKDVYKCKKPQTSHRICSFKQKLNFDFCSKVFQLYDLVKLHINRMNARSVL
jgi:hypothetical protein